MLFKKAICFSDMHLGLKNNSVTHNRDCLAYANWLMAVAKDRGCETCFFLGDWHHHRSGINLNTLHYTFLILKLLNDNFNQVYMLVGNHDLYYRESRAVHGLRFTELYPNITLIDEPTFFDDVALIPWLVKDEWKSIEGIKSKYVFGHFELPKFKLNQMIEMPNHGQLQADSFKGIDYVFSGHFHHRQVKENIVYIGSPFPHSYSDAWDDERGAMILEWDGKPEFLNWADMPKYRTISLDDLLTDPANILSDNMHVRISMDNVMPHEDVNYIKEILAASFHLRELNIMSTATRDGLDGGHVDENLSFESIDQIVTKQLRNIQSKAYDPEILVAIYNSV